jgi:DNA-binding winged helix-turn-helix (wHTH) protein
MIRDAAGVIDGSMSERYQVGEFALDADLCLLTRGLEVVPLPPKTFELLLELVRRAPGVVRRQELIDSVWPKELVNDEALTQRLMLLRRILGDDPKTPHYIASMPRWGYRVVADVRRLTSVEAPPREVVSQFVALLGDRLIPLPEGKTVIGRDPGAAVFIDSLRVSRHHARIVVTNGCARLEDLGSKNGTQVNGRRIAGVADLADGDRIGVAHEVVVFRVRARMGTTLTDGP